MGKYNDKYLDFGFNCTTVDDEEKPQCIVCTKILARESMIPNKLSWRNGETIVPKVIKKDLICFLT